MNMQPRNEFEASLEKDSGASVGAKASAYARPLRRTGRRGGPPRPTKTFGRTKGGATICVFPKRTHRFLTKRQQLSNTDTMSYAINRLGKTVGSFWKTNPPERVF